MKLDTLVAHYHEIGLKGRNRRFFEDALVRNLKRALRGCRYKRVRTGFGRVMVDLEADSPYETAARRVADVFGVAYVGLGRRVMPDMKAIGDTALELLTGESFDSFRVRTMITRS